MLTRWIELLPKDVKKLQVTGIKEMSEAKGHLKNRIDWKTLERYTKENKLLEDFHKKVEMDHLELGMIWEEEEDERGLMPEMESTSRVAEWLQTTVESRPRRMSALNLY